MLGPPHHAPRRLANPHQSTNPPHPLPTIHTHTPNPAPPTLQVKEHKMEHYNGRVVAIDASMAIYQFLVRFFWALCCWLLLGGGGVSFV